MHRTVFDKPSFWILSKKSNFFCLTQKDLKTYFSDLKWLDKDKMTDLDKIRNLELHKQVLLKFKSIINVKEWYLLFIFQWFFKIWYFCFFYNHLINENICLNESEFIIQSSTV